MKNFEKYGMLLCRMMSEPFNDLKDRCNRLRGRCESCGYDIICENTSIKEPKVLYDWLNAEEDSMRRKDLCDEYGVKIVQERDGYHLYDGDEVKIFTYMMDLEDYLINKYE